jgi:hypothetical protein
MRFERHQSEGGVVFVGLHALFFASPFTLVCRVDVRVLTCCNREDWHFRRLLTKLERPLDHHALQDFVDPPDVTQRQAARIRSRGRRRPDRIVLFPPLELFVDFPLDSVVTVVGNFQEESDRQRIGPMRLQPLQSVGLTVNRTNIQIPVFNTKL